MTNTWSQPIDQKVSTKQKKKIGLPPIPLQSQVPEEPKKGETLKVEMRTDPDLEDSKTYTINVKIFKAGAPEELLVWLKEFEHVIESMPLKTASFKFHMMRRMLQGEARRVFDNKSKEYQDETEQNFEKIKKT